MINLEAIKGIAAEEGKAYGKQKADETISNPEKFEETLDKISKNAAFLKLKNLRDGLDQKDKEHAYNAGKQMSNGTIDKIVDPLKLGILQTIKKMDPTISTVQALRYKNNTLKTLKLTMPGETFESAMRLCVQLGLLKRPNAITQEAILQDAQSDSKTINTKLTALEAVASIIPWLRPLLPLIQELKKYASKLGDASIQSIINKQNGKQAGQQETAPAQAESTYPPKEAAQDATTLKTGIQAGKVKEAVTKPASANNQEAKQQVASEKKGGASVGKEDKIEHTAN